MRSAALFSIILYQRYLSPYKGYCCAYRAYSGGASCSTLGFRAIRRYGLWDGLAILRGRLARCGMAYRRLLTARLPPRRQRGVIDGLCLTPLDFIPTPCDCFQFPWEKKSQEQESAAHIPQADDDDEKKTARRKFSVAIIEAAAPALLW